MAVAGIPSRRGVRGAGPVSGQAVERGELVAGGGLGARAVGPLGVRHALAISTISRIPTWSAWSDQQRHMISRTLNRPRVVGGLCPRSGTTELPEGFGMANLAIGARGADTARVVLPELPVERNVRSACGR